MASSAAENWAVINCDENPGEIEVSQIFNNSLLNSLFEESQAEDGDDERLRSFIQSLEAEIHPGAIKGHKNNSSNLEELEMDGYNDQKDHYQLYSGSGNVDCCCGQLDHSTSSHNLECFGWNVDDAEMSPSSMLSIDISNSWHKSMTGTGDGVVFEFEDVADYSHLYCYGAPTEEHGQDTSLWQSW